jgi:type IV secretory pathway VirB10-like protein
MYRSDLQNRDKGGAIAAVIAIHAGLLFVFLHLSGKVDLSDPQAVMRVFDVNEVPPPQSTPEPPTPAEETERPKEQEGAASAENLRSQATPVVAPEPPIQLPIPVPVNTTQTPNEGAAATQGAPTCLVPGLERAAPERAPARVGRVAGLAEEARVSPPREPAWQLGPCADGIFRRNSSMSGHAARGSACASGSMLMGQLFNASSIRAPATRP